MLFQRFACWSKDQHGLKLWMVNGESTSIFLLVNYNANSSSKLSVIHLNRRPTPSAVVIPDGGWLNTATIDWMVSGENSAILLFLKYNVLLTSTLSVFSYQFGLLVRKIRFPLLTIDHSPPQPAGCVTATPLLLLLFNPDCFGIKIPPPAEPNQKRRLMQLLV